MRVAIHKVLLSACAFASTAFSQVSSLTQHNDIYRTGANLHEVVLNTSNVNVNQFGKLFHRKVEGQIYAQPLYVPNVAIPGQGTHNVVYVATEHNSVYAFDADNPAASAPLWQVTLGAAVYYRLFSAATVSSIREQGITGTPAIDATTGTMYLVTYTSVTGTQTYRLHALDITTGLEKFNGPKVIEGSVKGTGEDSVGGIITFNPHNHLQRPAMLLLNSVLYIAFGSHGDQRIWHGWVFAYSPSTLQQLGVYNTTPNGSGGSLWQSGQGLTADEQGFAYFMTGNGTSTGDGVNISEAFGKIQMGSSNLSLADWFMVNDANTLNANDEDLGSAGVLHIPGTQEVLGGGKQGVLYVVSTSSLGQAGQPLQTLPVCFSGHLHGSPIYWSVLSRIYFWCEMDYLQAYNFVSGKLSTTRADVSTVQAPEGMPGGILSVSSNESVAGTGIVWAVLPYNGDAVNQTVEGELHAFDATNLSKELWNSKQNAAHDDSGDFAKFNPPLVVNGKVYLANSDGQLVVYGLLPAPAAEPDVYLINAGGNAEGLFRADSGFSGGTAAFSTYDLSGFVDVKAVANPAPQLVYRTARQGNFTYTLSSLKAGAVYVLRLQFAEFQATGIGQRLFNVAINGAPVLSNFDIFAAAHGPNTAIDRVFTATADATGSVTLQFTNGSAGSAQVNGIEIAPLGSASTTFLGVDAITQGNWTAAYGTNGYNIIGYASSYPAYATVAAAAPNLTTWSASTTDVSALKKLPPATDRIAATWSASTNFAVDVNLTDGASHKVSLYLLDWGTSNLRAEHIDVIDPVAGVVIDSQTVTSFSSGKYLSWNLKGHVRFRLAAMSDSSDGVTYDGENGSVLSGLFFDPPSSGTSGAPPTVWIDMPAANAVLSGTTTIGGWAIESIAAAGPNAISQVAVFVDGVEVGLATYGGARPDVCNIWPGRPGCPNVGWSYSLNTAVLAAGSHTLKIVATDTAGVTGSSQVTFAADSPTVFIDMPAANAVLSGTTTIGGWAIESIAAAGPNAISQVAVFVDGVEVGLATYGGARPDVCNIWPGRPGCPNVGWSYSLNTAALAAGSHTLKIVATDTKGVSGSNQVTFDN